jgi:hypothetical protein
MTDTDAAGTDAAEVRAEIDETRQALGDTVDALAGRLDVKSRVGNAVEQRKQQIRRRLDPAARQVADSPVPPAGLLVAVLAVLTLIFVLLRRRS